MCGRATTRATTSTTSTTSSPYYYTIRKCAVAHMTESKSMPVLSEQALGLGSGSGSGSGLGLGF